MKHLLQELNPKQQKPNQTNNTSDRTVSNLLRNCQRKIRMIQCLPDGTPLRRVKSQQPSDQVQKLPVDVIYWRNDLLQRTRIPHIPFTLSCRFRFRPSQVPLFAEKFRFGPLTRMRESFRHSAHHHFHHGKVLKVVVSLVKSNTGVEFDKDTTEGVGVAGE